MGSRDERQARLHGYNVIPALVVIAIGLLFLLNNFDIRLPFLHLENWWAYFILIGAAAPVSTAVRRYRRVGGIDAAVLHSLLAAAAIVIVALMFILQLSWARWWPLFVIYGGLCMLVRDRRGPAGT
ncbi:hypothetical protein ASG87_04215 [Frateuria sp. Soil773]|uniref:LiaF transmembrane domain-containing protein n=1 Tax=Frateuria sp. Soil773 TaxID=1736407 RepID=UPI0006F666C1|nr:hypothetical protein [Frateuria sp. Soil773]KRE89537.1 hypothetical protein ASG87_04215 [Frateuria sp. Soil773]